MLKSFDEHAKELAPTKPIDELKIESELKSTKKLLSETISAVDTALEALAKLRKVVKEPNFETTKSRVHDALMGTDTYRRVEQGWSLAD